MATAFLSTLIIANISTLYGIIFYNARLLNELEQEEIQFNSNRK